MRDATATSRGFMPQWDGERLSAAFAARRGRAWTLGYESFELPDVSSQVAWDGMVPNGLTGTLVRNGPARHERGGQRYGHRWDGDGMIQRFTIGPSGVSHLGRFVQTQKLLDEEAAGHMIYSGFGTPVDRSTPTAERIERSNPANINIVPFDNEYLALWEAGQPYRIDTDTLATAGRVRWLNAKQMTAFSAHPKFSADGTMWNFGVAPLEDRMHLYGIDRNGHNAWTQEMHVDQIAPMHDFGITEQYLVFLLPSFTCNSDRLLSGTSFAESCQWSPHLGMRAIVVRKDGSDRMDFRLPPGCLFHVANAWEEGDQICVDYMGCDDPSSLLAGWTVMAGKYRHVKGAALTRVVLDLRAGSAQRTTLIDHDAEFPSILPCDVSRPYESLLCLERSECRPHDVPGFDRLALIDAKTANRCTYTYGDGWLVEEHVLITGEAECTPKWAIGTALNLQTRSTVLSVFDVNDISGGPIARAQLPYSLPLGLHGTFIHSPKA